MEVETAAIMAGVWVEDTGREEEMGMAQGILGTIDHVASRCDAVCQSTKAKEKFISVCGCTE